MNELPTHPDHRRTRIEPDAVTPVPRTAHTLPVGDVVIRPDASGYGIFNYRGEPVLEAPVSSPSEAARLAAEIVSPWHGRVRMDDALLGH